MENTISLEDISELSKIEIESIFRKYTKHFKQFLLNEPIPDETDEIEEQR
jgi:hypothetical protein